MRLVRPLIVCSLLLPLAVLAVPPLPDEPSVPSVAVMGSWVQSTFPALVSSASVPENLYLGYVVNEQFEVLQHSAILRPGPRPMTQDVAAMFPSFSFATSAMGGIAQVSSTSGNRVGVIWVMVRSAQAQ